MPKKKSPKPEREDTKTTETLEEEARAKAEKEALLKTLEEKEAKAKAVGIMEEEEKIKEGYIEWMKILEAALFKPMQTAWKSKTVVDFAFETFLVLMALLPKMVEELAKEESRIAKEKNQKTQDARKALIDKSLKAQGTDRLRFVTQIALRAQDWLFDKKHVKFDLAGQVMMHGLTRFQKAHAQKYIFAHRLPLNADGSLNFERFSSRQARRFMQYMYTFVQYEPDFKRYVKSLIRKPLTTTELSQFAYLAGQMNLKSNAPKCIVVSSVLSKPQETRVRN